MDHIDSTINQLKEQIKVWKKERDMLDELIDDAYMRIDELEAEKIAII